MHSHSHARATSLFAAFVAAAAACLALAAPANAKPAPQPVVSQVYGGGGNAGAQFRNDYIEIFNRSGSTLDLTGWSVQYAAATSGSWSITPLSGTLEIGQYLLVAEGSGGGNGQLLPAADATGTIDLSNTTGKVALVSSFTPLTGTCPSGAQIMDLVGYGTSANCFEGAGPVTPNLQNTTAALRKQAGCTDTDNNSADFSVSAPTPRNTATARSLCFPVPAKPALTATDPPSPSNSLAPRVIGSAPAGTTVEVYANAACSGAPAATGSADQLAAPGIPVNAPANATTTYYALAFDANNASDCSTTSVTYVQDSVAPAAPTLISTSPASPANDLTPEIRGSAPDGTTVRLWTNAGCTLGPAATGTAAEFASPGLTVTVGADSTTTFYATATDAAGNTSPCSTSSITYIEDSELPVSPTFTGSVPGSPADDTAPNIKGTAEAGSTVRLYTDADCDTLAGSGTAAQFSSSGISVTVAANSTTTFYATATDGVGNTSACSVDSFTYVEDSDPPAEPTFDSSAPVSPAGDNSPLLLGTADADSTVRIYRDAACTIVTASGTAAQFGSPGIGVTVPANSTTTFHATATDAVGNTSGCSTSSLTYVEDSSPPAQPVLTASDPPSPSTDTTPFIIGTADAGSTVRLYSDAGCTNLAAPAATADTFAAPGIEVTVTPGTTTVFHATATDAVGNTSACSSSSLAYEQDSGAPTPPTFNVSVPASPAESTAPRILGSAEAGSTVRLYTDATCTALAATGTAAEFASPGIQVTVAAGSSTTFRATATDALNNTSACSPGSLTYVQRDEVPSPADPTPSLSGLRLSPPNFTTIAVKATSGGVVAGASRARGTEIVFSLSARARVSFTVLRRPPVAQPPGPDAGLIKTFGRILEAGPQVIPFSGRLGQRVFKPGKYRMFVTVRTVAGEAPTTSSVPFRILRG